MNFSVLFTILLSLFFLMTAIPLGKCLIAVCQAHYRDWSGSETGNSGNYRNSHPHNSQVRAPHAKAKFYGLVLFAITLTALGFFMVHRVVEPGMVLEAYRLTMPATEKGVCSIGDTSANDIVLQEIPHQFFICYDPQDGFFLQNAGVTQIRVNGRDVNEPVRGAKSQLKWGDTIRVGRKGEYLFLPQVTAEQVTINLKVNSLRPRRSFPVYIGASKPGNLFSSERSDSQPDAPLEYFLFANDISLAPKHLIIDYHKESGEFLLKKFSDKAVFVDGKAFSGEERRVRKDSEIQVGRNLIFRFEKISPFDWPYGWGVVSLVFGGMFLLGAVLLAEEYELVIPRLLSVSKRGFAAINWGNFPLYPIVTLLCGMSLVLLLRLSVLPPYSSETKGVSHTRQLLAMGLGLGVVVISNWKITLGWGVSNSKPEKQRGRIRGKKPPRYQPRPVVWACPSENALMKKRGTWEIPFHEALRWLAEKTVHKKRRWFYGVLLGIAIVTALLLALTHFSFWRELRGLIFIQPSEVAKVVVVFILAAVLVDLQAHQPLASFREKLIFKLLPLLTLVLVPIIPLFFKTENREHDFGPIVLVLALFLVMYYLGTSDFFWPVLLLIAVSGGSALIVAFRETVADWSSAVAKFLSRYDTWDNPYEISRGEQMVRGLWALKSSGPFGQGFGRGYHAIPVLEDDFIFTAFVQEAGYIAGLLLVGFYFLLFLQGVTIAFNLNHFYSSETSNFDFLLACGISWLFLIQTFLIVGGLTQWLPFAGQTTVFLSAGGSSVLVSLMSTAILLNLSRKGTAKP